MKALQIIQTFLLLLIILGVYENSHESEKVAAKLDDFRAQLQKVADDETALDRRVTTIEAKIKP